nr:hypothetical protein [Tanacetum cinerariifolium]
MGEIAIRELKKKLEIAQKEKDGIQLNVDKFEHASKSLKKLIDSQIVDNCKKGLGYENYNAVPPPYIGNFMPQTSDLYFNGLEEFVNKPVVKKYKAKSSEEEPKIHARVDGKEIVITESSVKRDLQLADEEDSDDDGSKPSTDDGKKVDEDPRKESECKDQEKKNNVNSTKNVITAGNVNTVSSTVNVAGTNEVNVVGGKISIELPLVPIMPALEDDSIFDFSSDDEDDGKVADINNLDTIIQVTPIPTTRIHKDHPLDQVIRDLQSATQTRKMSKNLEEHVFISTIQQRANHKDL